MSRLGKAVLKGAVTYGMKTTSAATCNQSLKLIDNVEVLDGKTHALNLVKHGAYAPCKGHKSS